MKNWVKEIPIEEISDDKEYFIGLRPQTPELGDPWKLNSRNKKGDLVWSTKPGIAVRVRGGELLRGYLRVHKDLAAIEIPDNANKRWRRRE